jgi:UDP-glucose 4-epimerase
VKNMAQRKKAIILGAAGFIGINLAHTLVKRGWEVICFDCVDSTHWPNQVQRILGDFAQMPPVLLDQMDQAVVFHLISSCRPSTNTDNIVDAVNYDVVSTLRYLEHCRSKALRWVYVSSGGTVYGHNDANTIVETASTKPICSYGVVKLTIEYYFSLYHQLHQTDSVIVRLANPYGPWQHPQRGQGLVAALIYKALKNDTIEVWGSGENVRDYIYIDDAIAGILAVAETGQSGEIYNVGTGIGTSINELISAIQKQLQLDIRVNRVTARSVDVKRNVLNIQKVTDKTKWKPAVDLGEGILFSADWIRSLI